MALINKVAVVTGGVQGIGRMIVETLLENKAKVCIADVQTAKGEKLKDELESKFGPKSVVYHHCDVTSCEEFESVFKFTREYFGTMDILVNNAGIADEREEKWRTMIDINLASVIYGTKLALKYMGKDQGYSGGYVINVASMAGLVTFDNCPVYTATKHGVVGFTKTIGLPLYYDKYRVRVNALCPSFVKTELCDNLSIKAWVPLTEIPPDQSIETSDIKNAFLKLVLDETNNGACLAVLKSGPKFWKLEQM